MPLVRMRRRRHIRAEAVAGGGATGEPSGHGSRGSTVERGVVGARVRGHRAAHGGGGGIRAAGVDFLEVFPQPFMNSLGSHIDRLMARFMMEQPRPDFGTLAPPPRQRPPFAGEFRCQICSHRYLDREPTAVPQCGHIFCAACIRAEREPRCPQCLEMYVPDSLTRVFIN